MGMVMYKASPGGLSFLEDILERMPVVNDVDQGIANHFVGGSRGKARDHDKYNPNYWRGQYGQTKCVDAIVAAAFLFSIEINEPVLRGKLMRLSINVAVPALVCVLQVGSSAANKVCSARGAWLGGACG